jgi:hypothetical protein
MVEFGGPTCQPGVRELLDGIALRAIQPGDEAWLHAIFSCTRDAERQLLAWPPEFDTNRRKSLICIGRASWPATTTRIFERCVRVS